MQTFMRCVDTEDDPIRAAAQKAADPRRPSWLVMTRMNRRVWRFTTFGHERHGAESRRATHVAIETLVGTNLGRSEPDHSMFEVRLASAEIHRRPQ